MTRIPLTSTSEVADKPPAAKVESPPSSSVSDAIEVPYTDYKGTHGHPYVVDHYQLGDTWEDPVGGFPSEVTTIESYIEKKISLGEVANSVSAIKTLIRGLEKINNLNKEERAVVNVGVLSNYVEFLMKNDRLKGNLKKYHG